MHTLLSAGKKDNAAKREQGGKARSRSPAVGRLEGEELKEALQREVDAAAKAAEVAQRKLAGATAKLVQCGRWRRFEGHSQAEGET